MSSEYEFIKKVPDSKLLVDAPLILGVKVREKWKEIGTQNLWLQLDLGELSLIVRQRLGLFLMVFDGDVDRVVNIDSVRCLFIG